MSAMEWDVDWVSPVLAPFLDQAFDLRESNALDETDWNFDLELVGGMLRPVYVARWHRSAQYPPGYDDQVALEGNWSSRHLEDGLDLDDPNWPSAAMARGLLVAERVELAAAAFPGVGRLTHVFTLGLGDPDPIDPGWYPSATHRFHTLIPGLWYFPWESGEQSPEQAFGSEYDTVYGGARLTRRLSRP